MHHVGKPAKQGCLSVQGDPLQFACFQPRRTSAALPTICLRRANCQSHGKELQSGEVMAFPSPSWEMLLLKQFLKDPGREGKAFSLRKEQDVSKCRNKMAATKWSNFCMMLLFPGLYRCGNFFTSCSAVKYTCRHNLFFFYYYYFI